MKRIIPSNWLKRIITASHRDYLIEAIEHDTPASLDRIPILFTCRFTWAAEAWLTSSAAKYGHPVEEVVEIVGQMGLYIHQVYPRVSEQPRVPYFHGIFPVDYLQTRAQNARARAGQQLSWASGLVGKLEARFAELGAASIANPVVPILDDEPVENAQNPLILLAGHKFEENEPNPVESIALDPRTRALSGELVYYLFDEGLNREQDPQELLQELASTARFLDYNFADEAVPTLREQLLVKVMAAERASLETDRVLSALETLLVDVAKPFNSLEHLMSRMLPMTEIT
jgi:hypothetical protein